MGQFTRWVPVRTPAVERIEQNIATFGVEMPNDKFPGGVVNDDRVATFSKLIQKLGDKHRLSRTGVAHDQEVQAFVLAAHTNDFLLRSTGSNANPVSAPHLVKIVDCEDLRSADVLASPFADNVGSVQVDADRYDAHEYQVSCVTGHPEEITRRLAAIDVVAQMPIQLTGIHSRICRPV